MRFIVLVLVIVAVSTAFLFQGDLRSVFAADENKKDKKSKKSKKSATAGNTTSDVFVKASWNMPARLKEVSGVAFMDNGRFACVQDEEGVIFIYNSNTGQVEKEIPFAAPGDYEGISLAGNTAYVVRSDGKIYEVTDITRVNSMVKEHNTPLTAKHNVEGLFYDKVKNRLLLAIKADEPGNKSYKGVYAFDIKTKITAAEPVYKLHLDDPLLSSSGKKKPMPSEIAIHPTTTDIYILDAARSRLMVMNANGDLQQVYAFGGDFEKPEGITFSPAGEMFISNEGVKSPPNIKQVELRKP